MAKPTSEIENAIDNLESYIASCKFQFGSNSRITVKKEDIEYYIQELRAVIPDEVERCRKIISNKDAIISETQEKADAMLADVRNKTSQLLSENEIMIKANEEANALVNEAAMEAQSIIEQAQLESMEYKNQAQRYLNDMLVTMQGLIYDCIDSTATNTNKFIEELNKVGVTVSNNLDELNGVEPEPQPLPIDFDQNNNDGKANGLESLSNLNSDSEE